MARVIDYGTYFLYRIMVMYRKELSRPVASGENRDVSQVRGYLAQKTVRITRAVARVMGRRVHEVNLARGKWGVSRGESGPWQGYDTKGRLPSPWHVMATGELPRLAARLIRGSYQGRGEGHRKRGSPGPC